MSNTESIPVARSDNDCEKMAAYTVISDLEMKKRDYPGFGRTL